MSRPSEIGDTPPVAVFLFAAEISAAGTLTDPATTAEQQYASAVANLPGYGSYSLRTDAFGLVARATKSGKKYGSTAGTVVSAGVRRFRYRWAFYSATCCLRLDWTEEHDGASDQAENPLNYVWMPPSNAGVCLLNPARGLADYPGNGVDDGKVFLTPEYELIADEPPDPENDMDSQQNTTTIQEFRYSAVQGYTAPSDGSANGFPD